MNWQESVVITLTEEELYEALALWLRKHKMSDLIKHRYPCTGDGDRDFNFNGADCELRQPEDA